MFYLIPVKFKRFRGYIVAFLIAIISIFTFQNNIFAGTILDDEAKSYHIEGYKEQQKGNLNKALTLYHKALSLGLQDAVLFNNIGVAFEQLGDLRRAEEYYLRAIETNRDYLPPYTNLAYFYKEAGQKEKAIEFFEERIRLAPRKDPWVEKIRKEIDVLDPGIRIGRIMEAVDDQLEQIQKLRNETLYQAVGLEVMRAKDHLKRADQHLSSNNYDAAIAEFKNALSFTPGNPSILRAIEDAKKAKKIGEIRKHAQTAIENIDSGDMQSAEQEFQEILSIIPENSNQKSE